MLAPDAIDTSRYADRVLPTTRGVYTPNNAIDAPDGKMAYIKPGGDLDLGLEVTNFAGPDIKIHAKGPETYEILVKAGGEWKRIGFPYGSLDPNAYDISDNYGHENIRKIDGVRLVPRGGRQAEIDAVENISGSRLTHNFISGYPVSDIPFSVDRDKMLQEIGEQIDALNDKIRKPK
jgi:hypothetical protein